ncbi:hypothetical protein ACQEVF_44110 [Nonomuraea polychroma]
MIARPPAPTWRHPAGLLSWRGVVALVQIGLSAEAEDGIDQ